MKINLRRLAGLARLPKASPHLTTAVATEPLVQEQKLLDLHAHVRAPAVIATAELLRWRRRWFVRVRSNDGVEGIAVGSERLEFLWPLLTQRVLPFLVGRDARDVERLVDQVTWHEGNYKLSGLAFWSCVAAAEMAIFDLLGKSSGKSVGELLGGVSVPMIPVYLSSLRRGTTAEQEVALVGARLAETLACAVKLKIGGRQGVFDVSPGRTEQLVALARRTWGDEVTILVDANGSFDVEQAVETGRMLESHAVFYFEEPCSWEDFEATKQVADRLEKVQIAGGEQDGSFEKFRWIVRNRGVDVLTPDVVSNGGFVRTLRIVRLAAEAGIDVSFHSARSDYLACAMLHMASATPGLFRPHEFLADAPRRESWYSPNFRVIGGHVAAPTGPGLGMSIDPAVLRRANVV